MRTSITHHHLCAVINTEIEVRGLAGVVRILDMGCGDGRLMALLQRELPRLRPGISFDIHGFDVGDAGVQPAAFFERTRAFLSAKFPAVDWSTKLQKISSHDQWPYEDASFDIVVSNQVMEHVRDHDFTFGQLRRVLRDDGVSIHLFPLKCCVYEPHLNLPGVHWIARRGPLMSYIRLCSRLGMGKYPSHRRQLDGRLTVDAFADRHADYMVEETNYLMPRQLRRLARRQRLRCRFRYTSEFYTSKLRALAGRPYRRRYAVRRSRPLDRLALALYMFVASVTVLLAREPEDAARRG